MINIVVLIAIGLVTAYIASWFMTPSVTEINSHLESESKQNHQKLKQALKKVRNNNPDLKLYYVYLFSRVSDVNCQTPEELIDLFVFEENLKTINVNNLDKDLVSKINDACHYGYINEIFHEMLDHVQLHPVNFRESFTNSYYSWQTTNLEEKCKMLYSPIQQLITLKDGKINNNSKHSN